MLWIVILLKSEINFLLAKGRSPALRMSTYHCASIISQKMTTLVAPFIEMPPQMKNFHGVLWLRPKASGLAFLVVAFTMGWFQLNHGLICKNNILKCVTIPQKHVTEVESLLFVLFSYQLAIPCSIC